MLKPAPQSTVLFRVLILVYSSTVCYSYQKGKKTLSIHPFSTAYPGSDRRGSSLSREAHTSLSPATSSSSSGVIPKAFPGQPRETVPPACPGSSRGPPTGSICPEHLTREASGTHPSHPTLLVVEEQQVHLLPHGRASPSISKGEPSHPAE